MFGIIFLIFWPINEQVLPIGVHCRVAGLGVAFQVVPITIVHAQVPALDLRPLLLDGDGRRVAKVEAVDGLVLALLVNLLRLDHPNFHLLRHHQQVIADAADAANALLGYFGI